MPLLTTTQIAARLGVTERTAYRWIERGWLQATKTPRGNKYDVAESELERLARFEPDEMSILQEKCASLEKRVLVVESELVALREVITRMEQRPRFTHGSPTHKREVSTASAGPGDIPARRFAEDHGLTRDSMLGWIKRGQIETTERAIGRTGERTQHMLTPAQQRAAIQFWLDNNIIYAPCPGCPHIPS